MSQATAAKTAQAGDVPCGWCKNMRIEMPARYEAKVRHQWKAICTHHARLLRSLFPEIDIREYALAPDHEAKIIFMPLTPAERSGGFDPSTYHRGIVNSE